MALITVYIGQNTIYISVMQFCVE